MKPLLAALIGLALAGSASAANFVATPVPSPFPDQPSWQQPQRWANPPPQQYEQPQQGNGQMFCQNIQGGLLHCWR